MRTPKLCSTDGCVANTEAFSLCRKHYSARRYLANQEKLKEQMRNNYAIKKDEYKKRAKDWAEKNRDKVLANAKQKYRDNKEERLAGCKLRYQSKKPEILAKCREWKLANPERVLASNRKSSLKNRLQINARVTESRNKDRKKYREERREWKKKNPGKVKALDAKRRAAKLQRTPHWADLKAIQLFYENCPTGHHVDHIVPLCGKQVSGLHVLENLQYLPAEENLRKLNKFEPKVGPYPWPK